MNELRLRDDRGRFASPEEENAQMNSMLRFLAGGAPSTPAPTRKASGAGQPVPPGAGMELPADDENMAMNRALREMCGVADPDSR